MRTRALSEQLTVHALRCRCSHGLTHLSADGQTPRMVDVSNKMPTVRTAVARSEVELPPAGVFHEVPS